MPRTWKPSQKELSVYEQLLKKYNKMRQQVIKAHRALEEHTPSGRMPSLVVPERHRKMTLRQIQIGGRRLFKLKLRQLKTNIRGGLGAFFKRYKDGYLELYRDLIGETPELNPFHSSAKGFLYSEEQIKLAHINEPELAKFMRTYNDIVRLNPAVFTLLIKSGKIPSFQRLYDELGRGLTFPEKVVDETHKAVRFWGYRLNTREGVKWANETLKGEKKAIERYIKYVHKDTEKIRKGIKVAKGIFDEE